MEWRRKRIIILDDDLSDEIKDSAKNRRTIESIKVLITKTETLSRDLDDLDEKLEY